MVRPSPITHLLPFSVGAYAWRLHGWLVGLIMGLSYIMAVIAANHLYILRMASDDTELDQFVGALQRIKWAFFVIFMIGLGVSAATVAHAFQ